MKFIQLADLHLTKLFPSDIQESQKAVLQLAMAEYRRRGCDRLLLLGDVIHDKMLIYIQSLNVLEETISENQDINFQILIGNHDFVGKPTDHGFRTLAKYSNVQVVDRPTVETDAAGHQLVFLPYSKDIHDVLPTLSGDVLFSHFGVNEAQVNPGFSVYHRIRLSDLTKFRKTFLGHYHLPQHLEFGDDSQLWYVGSAISKDWNDKNQQKRLLFFDSETDVVDEIPINCITKFVELTIAHEADAAAILEQREQLREAGHKVRVRSSAFFKTDDRTIIFDAAPETETAAVDVHTLSHRDLIVAWANQRLPDAASLLTLEELIEFGAGLYDEAKERYETAKQADQDSDDDSDDDAA